MQCNPEVNFSRCIYIAPRVTQIFWYTGTGLIPCRYDKNAVVIRQKTAFFRFQSLIGAIKTVNVSEFLITISKFQSLIGTIKTDENFLPAILMQGFNPS
ncbi:hypothetical protein DI44_18535 [Geobacillus sp. CAMR5420]|nr:hypothetical protein DI44_18535 [Geobacillus sp. CAMR5420]